jgi:hypothetical protein
MSWVTVVAPVCTGLSVTPDSGEAGFVASINCTGKDVDTYRILVKDSNGGVLRTYNSNVATHTFSQVGE